MSTPELAPDWVSLDREVTLLGLEPDQIRQVLEERTGRSPGGTKSAGA